MIGALFVCLGFAALSQERGESKDSFEAQRLRKKGTKRDCRVGRSDPRRRLKSPSGLREVFEKVLWEDLSTEINIFRGLFDCQKRKSKKRHSEARQ
jgi:hypothetical protein